MSRKAGGRRPRVRPYREGADFDIDVSTMGMGFSLLMHRQAIELGNVGSNGRLCVVCDGDRREADENGRIVVYGERRSVMQEMRGRGYRV